MDIWVVAITAIASIVASSGFWAFIQTYFNKKSLTNKMLLGLAHDRIIELGMEYIKRGSISHDELENLLDYLYTPYKKMGGNGSAERVMEQVTKLRITNSPEPGWPEIDRRKRNENQQ